MANVLRLGVLNGAFLIREAFGMYRSREEADVTAPGAVDPNTGYALASGTLLQRDNATGVYSRLTLAGEVAGILFEGIGQSDDGEEQTVRRTVVVRDCEVHKTELIYPAGATDTQMATVDTALRALGVIPRL